MVPSLSMTREDPSGPWTIRAPSGKEAGEAGLDFSGLMLVLLVLLWAPRPRPPRPRELERSSEVRWPRGCPPPRPRPLPEEEPDALWAGEPLLLLNPSISGREKQESIAEQRIRQQGDLRQSL